MEPPGFCVLDVILRAVGQMKKTMIIVFALTLVSFSILKVQASSSAGANNNFVSFNFNLMFTGSKLAGQPELVFGDGFEDPPEICGLAYADTDGDGYGDPASTPVETCGQNSGMAYNSLDCDDSDPAVNPGHIEICDGKDNNCNASVDDQLTPPLNTNQLGVCQASVQQCNGMGGWVDSFDSIPDYSLDDVPDGSFADNNCDGIDGDVANGIFVSTAGDDGELCGTLEAPCTTIGKGISRASSVGIDHVYIQVGSYVGAIDTQDGISLYGGFNTDWVRASRTVSGHKVEILGTYNESIAQYIAVRGYADTLEIADLFIAAPSAVDATTQSGQGKSSYGLYFRLGNVTLSRLTVKSGDGAVGAAGEDGISASSSRASGGGSGGPAVEKAELCNASGHGAGGMGGNQSCSGKNVQGGSGGNGGEMDTSCSVFGTIINANATSGDPGQQGCTGGPYSCGSVTFVSSGGFAGGGGSAASCAPGGNGGTGRVSGGAGGKAGSGRGRLISNFWYANNGEPGSIGKHGGGGGGGGGSGGCDVGTDSWGAGGGGGGAGGCSASAGGDYGRGAGGSFGVFGYQTDLTIRDTSFVQGDGGDGGHGGAGACGQPGGLGGSGGAPDGTGSGGRGGYGGTGGNSGGGGGGAGGHSYGIYRYEGTLDFSGNTFSSGAPGLGGTGGGNTCSGMKPTGSNGGNGSIGTQAVCSSINDC